jgi:hypothetical protein
MSIINAVRVALENHLNTTPATPAPALPAIAWPNVPYARVEGTPFILAEFIPTLRRAVVAGPTPEQRTSGLFYLTIHTPEDRGANDGMALADKLLSRFNASEAILASSVIVRLDYSEVKMPLHSPPFYAIPVEIGWYAYSR